LIALVWAWRAVTLLVGVAAFALTARTVNPHEAGRYPLCPFHAATGLDCPGCGSLRAVHDLLHGDAAEAVGHNALLIAFLPIAITAALRWSRGKPPHRIARSPATALTAVAVVVLWTLVRNVWPVPLGAA
jgi:hypothetical protein